MDAMVQNLSPLYTVNIHRSLSLIHISSGYSYMKLKTDSWIHLLDTMISTRFFPFQYEYKTICTDWTVWIIYTFFLPIIIGLNTEKVIYPDPYSFTGSLCSLHPDPQLRKFNAVINLSDGRIQIRLSNSKTLRLYKMYSIYWAGSGYKIDLCFYTFFPIFFHETFWCFDINKYVKSTPVNVAMRYIKMFLWPYIFRFKHFYLPAWPTGLWCQCIYSRYFNIIYDIYPL